MDKMKEYIIQNKDKFHEEFKIIDTPLEKLKMNKLIYPYYMETTKLAKINKYISVKEMNEEEVYDIVFDILMQFVQKYLNDNIKPNVKPNIKSTKEKVDMNIKAELELMENPKYTYDDELDMMTKYNDDSTSDTTSDSENTSTISTSSDNSN
jgi:hypothetical protein